MPERRRRIRRAARPRSDPLAWVDDPRQRYRFASPPLRFLATLLDRVLVVAATAPLLFLPVSGLAVALARWAMLAVYEVVAIARYGRTLGDAVVSIRVVRLDGASVPGWGRAARRWLLPAIAGLVAAIAFADARAVAVVAIVADGVVYLPVFWDRRRQGLHDRVAGTIVPGPGTGS